MVVETAGFKRKDGYIRRFLNVYAVDKESLQHAENFNKKTFPASIIQATLILTTNN